MRLVTADRGQCEAFNRELERCRHWGWFDNYHFRILCNRHADMEDPPFTAEQARQQRCERDNRLHQAWRDRQTEEAA